MAYFAATAVVGGYAWASSSGFAPTGRQVVEGFLDDVRALLKNRNMLSAVLAALSVLAALVGGFMLSEPLKYFQPADLRWTSARPPTLTAPGDVD